MSATTRSIASAGAILAASLLTGSCTPGPARLPSGVAPDRYLLDQGTAELEEHNWFDARQNFQQLLDSYPQSTLRMDAKIGMGDAYFGEDSPPSYVKAINEYREFLTFYPSHEKAAWAQYRIAMANFNQMRGAKRDQSKTEDAVEEFELFLERYPNDELAPEVRTRLREARDRWSQAQYLVGYFYFRQRWYPGAILRFRDILDSDPQYSGRDAVYFYLAESLYVIQRSAEALPYYERLIAEFEQSKFLEDAWERVRELKADETTPSR